VLKIRGRRIAAGVPTRAAEGSGIHDVANDLTRAVMSTALDATLRPAAMTTEAEMISTAGTETLTMVDETVAVHDPPTTTDRRRIPTAGEAQVPIVDLVARKTLISLGATVQMFLMSRSYWSRMFTVTLQTGWR
jgi:hypothetical protein